MVAHFLLSAAGNQKSGISIVVEHQRSSPVSLFYLLERVKDLRIGQVGEVPQEAFVNPTSMILVDE